MSNGSEGMSEVVDPHNDAPASKLLGEPGNDLPMIVVADDVRYLDNEGVDVTEEVIANNLDAVVRDTTVPDDDDLEPMEVVMPVAVPDNDDPRALR